MFRTFNWSSKVKGAFKLFSGDASASYFKSIKEKAYTLSVNYFQKVSRAIEYEYTLDQESTFSDIGKKIYKEGKNPLFRVFCGNRLLRSYEEGAGLVFTFQVQFSSREFKETFKAKAGFSFGGFIGASAEIAKSMQSLNISGRIIVQAL